MLSLKLINRVEHEVVILEHLSSKALYLNPNLHLAADLVGHRRSHMLYTQDGGLACIALLSLRHARLAVFVSGRETLIRTTLYIGQ